MTRNSAKIVSWVPTKEFEKHLALFPMLAVDIIVTNSTGHFLLLKRSKENYTWAGEWATPGGRVYRNEPLLSAARRILKRETSLSVPTRKFELRGFLEIITSREHAVTIVCKTRVETEVVAIDSTSAEAGWFSRRALPGNLRAEYKKILSM